MDALVRIFTFPPLVPVYILAACWLLVWFAAWVLSWLMASGATEEGVWIDVTVYKAWAIALGLHLLAVVILSGGALSSAFGWALIGWLLLSNYKAALLAYFAVGLIDLVLILSLFKHKQISESVPQ